MWDLPGSEIKPMSSALAGRFFTTEPPVVNLIPGQEDFPGEGNGNPIQYSCLENAKDRGAWQRNPWAHKESDTT